MQQHKIYWRTAGPLVIVPVTLIVVAMNSSAWVSIRELSACIAVNWLFRGHWLYVALLKKLEINATPSAKQLSCFGSLNDGSVAFECSVARGEKRAVQWRINLRALSIGMKLHEVV